MLCCLRVCCAGCWVPKVLRVVCCVMLCCYAVLWYVALRFCTGVSRGFLCVVALSFWRVCICLSDTCMRVSVSVCVCVYECGLLALALYAVWR